MSYEIKLGSPTDAAIVDTLIPEFDNNKSTLEITSRIADKKCLTLIAYDEDLPVGYLVGYELEQGHFYCWLTGVSPAYRGKGIASQLLQKQEAWAQAAGYQTISVKSKNMFPSMLRLLINQGFKISDYEHLGCLLSNKIHFVKYID